MGNSMTTEQIDVLDAGPEMDCAVQEVLQSVSGVIHFGLSDGLPRDQERHAVTITVTEFRPSTDWNDAMYAAERFGLFETKECLLDCCETVWGVTEKPVFAEWWLSFGDDLRQVATAPTGPLAICRALLKLHAGGAVN